MRRGCESAARRQMLGDRCEVDVRRCEDVESVIARRWI